jgi:SagB-type dehydrogenase family enzyme
MGHKLGVLERSEEIGDHIANATLQPELIQTSAATFIWTAVAARMTWRYGDRGYRYIHLDAGHVGQNLYLGVLAVNCKVCTSAAFNDDDLNRALKLDGVEHFAVYSGSVGR